MIDKLHSKIDGFNLRPKRLVVINDMIGTKLLDPFSRFKSRGGCDNIQTIDFRKLNSDRADTPCPADNQERFTRIGSTNINAQSIEECFVSGNRCRRERCGLRETESLGFRTNDSLVDQLEFRIVPGRVMSPA